MDITDTLSCWRFKTLVNCKWRGEVIRYTYFNITLLQQGTNLWIERKGFFQKGYCLHENHFKFSFCFLLLTFKNGNNLPDLDRSITGELTHGHFQKIQWLANEEQHNDVRDEEGTTAIFVRRVRETPNIAYVEINYTPMSSLEKFAGLQSKFQYPSRRTWRCTIARIPADCPTFLFRWFWHPPSPSATPEFPKFRFGNIHRINLLCTWYFSRVKTFFFLLIIAIPVHRQWPPRSDKAVVEWWIVGRHPVGKRRCWIH